MDKLQAVLAAKEPVDPEVVCDCAWPTVGIIYGVI